MDNIILKKKDTNHVRILTTDILYLKMFRIKGKSMHIDHININEEDGVNILKQENNIIDPGSNNVRILYITFSIIVGILLLWIIIVVITKEDAIKILGEMNNLSIQVPPANDSNVYHTSSIDTVK